MNLQEFLRKSKGVGDRTDNILSRNTLLILILILTSLASFGLGRLSKIDEAKPSINLIKNTSSATANEAINPQIEIGNYVASKNGSKYHLPWCSGANRIKEENKIYFNSKEEAEGAGYSPALNCKGI